MWGGTYTELRNNYIGTDPGGTFAVPNGTGVWIVSSCCDALSGPLTANVISGNGDGILILANDNNATVTIARNLIGTAADGISPLGNTRYGINAAWGTTHIGDASPLNANVIDYNGTGVCACGSNGERVTVGINQFWNNTRLGIDLGDDGVVTPNDSLDPIGPQNFPVITSAVKTGPAVNISASLNSAPNAAFSVFYYSSPACDASGYGEGKRFIGEVNAKTDASGNADVSATPNLPLAGPAITAIANGTQGSSEFSQCVMMTCAPAAWPTPTGDTDCDGFADTAAAGGRASEAYLGTDAGTPCAATATPNDEPPPDAWPVDFNDDQLAGGQDILAFAPVFNTSVPPTGARFDLNGDGRVGGQDILKFGPFFNKRCA